MIRQLASIMKVSYGTMQKILRDELGYSRICARWVPRLLTNEMKGERVRVCTLWRDALAADPTWFDNVVTMDEAWMYCYDPAMKYATTEWRPKGSEPPVKQRATKSMSKALAITFFDKWGVIFMHWVPRGQTVNQHYMIKVFRQLTSVHIPRKRPEFKKGKWKVHMDNARPHLARLVLAWLAKNHIEVVPHPLYSPDLARNDFFLYPAVKKVRKGMRFESVTQLKTKCIVNCD